MSTIDLTLFMSMKDIKSSGDTQLDLSDPQTAIIFNQTASTVHSVAGMPRYWGFASYKDKHNQGSLIHNQAIVLEYAHTERQRIESAVAAEGWNALIFASERPNQNTVTVVLPLEQAIPGNVADEKGYTRAATVVAHLLSLHGVWNLVDGKANTFLVHPIAFPKAVVVSGYALRNWLLNNHTLWLEFKDYCQPNPAHILGANTLRVNTLSDGPVTMVGTSIASGTLTCGGVSKNQKMAFHMRALADLFDKEGN